MLELIISAGFMFIKAWDGSSSSSELNCCPKTEHMNNNCTGNVKRYSNMVINKQHIRN